MAKRPLKVSRGYTNPAPMFGLRPKWGWEPRYRINNGAGGQKFILGTEFITSYIPLQFPDYQIYDAAGKQVYFW